MSERVIYFDNPGDGETSIYEVVTTTFHGKRTLEALFSVLDKSWTDGTRGTVGLKIVDVGNNIEIHTDEGVFIIDYGKAQLLKLLLTELDIQTENPNLPKGTLIRASDVQEV